MGSLRATGQEPGYSRLPKDGAGFKVKVIGKGDSREFLSSLYLTPCTLYR
jgi:hypothetical protein